MSKKLLSVFAAVLVFGAFFAFTARAQTSNSACPPGAGFFTRMGCLFNLAVDSATNIFTGNKTKSIVSSNPAPIVKDQSLEAITEEVRSASQGISVFNEAYDKAPSEEKKAILASLIEQAQERKETMLNLLEKDPQKFLLSTLPPEKVLTLPKEVRGYFEKPVTVEGKIEVVHLDNFKEPKNSKFKYFLKTENSRYEIFPVGDVPAIISGTTLKVAGVALGNNIVVKTGAATFSIIDSPEPESLGEQKALFLFINFLDSAPSKYTISQIKDGVNSHFNAYYREQSYGKTWWKNDFVDRWITVSESGCPNIFGMDWTNISRVVLENGVDLSKYDRIVFLENDPCYGYGGYSSVGKWSVMVGSSTYRLSLSSVYAGPADYLNNQHYYPGAKVLPWTYLDNVLSHELGHALGVLHANSWSCTKEILYGGDCLHLEYGNPFDVMGQGTASLHFNGYYKKLLGWLDTNSFLNITKSGRYVLKPLEGGGNGLRSVSVGPRESPLYLEYRRGIGFDARLNDPLLVGNQKGLFVNKVVEPESFGGGATELLDMDKTTSSDRFDWKNWESVTLNSGVFNDPGKGFSIGPIVNADESGITFDVNVAAPQCVRRFPQVNPSYTGDYGYESGVPGFSGERVPISYNAKNDDGFGCRDSTFATQVKTPPGWKIEYRFENSFTDSNIYQIKPGENKNITVMISIPEDEEAGLKNLEASVINVSDAANSLAKNLPPIKINVKIPPNVTLASSSPTSTKILAGSENVPMLDVLLKAGNEEVKIDGAFIGFFYDYKNQFKNIKVYDGETLLGFLNVESDTDPSKFTNFLNFKTQLVLPAGISKILRFLADISPDAKGSNGIFLMNLQSGDYIRGLPLLGKVMSFFYPFSLISPNGGERWMLQSEKTVVKWKPDPPDYPEVKAYLEKKEGENFKTIGEMLPVAKGSIQWYGDVGSYDSYPEPGDNYYVRVVDTQTGAGDRSDAPFTILPADFMKVDLKVNGSDGPIQLREGAEKIKITWTSANAENCSFYSNELGEAITDLPPVGEKTITLNENTFGTKWVYLSCSSQFGNRGDGVDLRFLKSLDVPGGFSADLEFATSTGTSTAQVALRWTDTSAEEEGFEVWRSANDESNYSLLATLPANAVSYMDGALKQADRPAPETAKESPGFLGKTVDFITGLFSKAPERAAEAVSALPAGVELDLPDYYPKELLKPQKLFSGRSIRVPKDKLAEIEIVSAGGAAGLVLKPKRVRGNYISFEVDKGITEETDLKIKLKSEAGEIEEKTFKVFGTPPEIAAPLLQKQSFFEEEKKEKPNPASGEKANIVRKNLNCGNCFWEMVMAGEPGESDNLLIQGMDRILRTVNGWLSWTDEPINEITVKDSGFALRWSADGKLVVDKDGNFVLPGIVVVPKVGSVGSGILGGGVHFGNVGGGPLTEKVIENATNPPPMADDWIYFDFPKVARHGDNIYIAANAVKFSDGNYGQGFFISNDGGKTFQRYKRADALGGYVIVNMASDANGEIYALLPDEIKLLRSLGGGDFETHSVASQWPRSGESMLVGFPRLSTGSNRAWYGGYFGNVVIAVDKTNSSRRGRIYVAYTKPEQVFYDPNFEYRFYGYNFDIFVTYSDNQGKTWSEPTRINDDAVKVSAPPGPARYFYKVRAFKWEEQCRIGITKKFGLICKEFKVYSDFSRSQSVELPVLSDGKAPGDQLYPSISLDEEGGVHFAWFDRRGIMDTPYYNVYYAYSKDGGRTFSKNVKVTSDPIPNFYGGRNPGDYLDMIAAYRDKVHIAYPCNLSINSSSAEEPTDLCVATLTKEKPKP